MPTRILLASDDESLRSFLSRVLTKAGYQVTAVRSGVAAVAALLSERKEFALALLDSQQPPVSGPKVISTLREAACLVPVILASGSFIADDVAMDDSNFAFLSKPFSGAELLGTVKKLLQEK